MISDAISNFIVSIRNGSSRGKESVVVPFSKMRMAIADLLVKEGFIKSATKKGKKLGKSIEIKLLYVQNRPAIEGVERVSRFSRRVYEKSKNLRPVQNGYGALILTTTKGILTEREARKAHVGGEALFKIW